MKAAFSLILLLFLSGIVSAQDNSTRKIYISRPKRADASLIKFRLLVNGAKLTLPNNSYAELEIKANSVKIELADAPAWMKTGSSVTTTDSVAYFTVYAAYPGGVKKETITIEQCSKQCYDDNIKNSKKKIELD